MTTRRLLVPVALSAALLSGCGTYMEAKQNVRPGGALDQQKAAANQQLAAAQAQNTRLQDEHLQREREIERMEKRIQAAQSELAKQQEALANALRNRQITQARHDELKRDMNALQAEMQTMDLQNKLDRGAKAPDPAAQAAKEKKLAELEQKKKNLEAAMAALVRR